MLTSLAYSVTTGSICWLSGRQSWEIYLGSGVSLLSTLQLRNIGGLTSVLAVLCYSYLRNVLDNKARTVFVRSRDVSEPVRRRLAETIERIVSTTPSLSAPQYTPTLLAANTWSNIILLMLKQKLVINKNDNFIRDTLTTDDGGTVSVDWAADAAHLPEDAPVVIFLHTVTGSARELLQYTRDATRRGWRSCVFTRRGHGGMRLSSGKFNLMGDAEDTVMMVEHVQTKYPHSSYLGMVGVSAGSGLLVTYLGKEGDATPVRAACSLCPAYDVSQAFYTLSELFPFVDNHLLASIKKQFIIKNYELLGTCSQEALIACSQAKTVQEFFDAHYPFAGFSSMEEYYKDSNPMNWVSGIQRPTLLVNSEDDMVCLPDNIREDVILEHGGALLLRTKRGSHIAYNEGLLGQGNYLSRVSLDFLESSRKLEKV